MFSKFLALLLLGVVARALSPYVLHEKRAALPSGWNVGRRFDADEVLPLRFGLRQSNLNKLEDWLLEVSHPESSKYGNHWTAGQVADAFAPSQASIDTVHSWLASQGVDKSRLRISPTRGWIMVNATVREAERLLKTEYNVYEHAEGDQHIGCESYHLPEHVSPHVELVTPSLHFDTILKKRGSSVRPAKRIGLPGVGIKPKTTGTIDGIWNDLQNCSSVITPMCLRALYHFVYEPVSADRNSFGIVRPRFFNQQYSKDLVGKSPKIVSVDGGFVQTLDAGFDYNGESNLDLQYGLNLVNMFGAQQNVTLYQVGDLVQGALNSFIFPTRVMIILTMQELPSTISWMRWMGATAHSAEEMILMRKAFIRIATITDCGIVKPANVISTSYGYNEAELTPFYTARQCAEYGKLGLMGVTVLYSSGDNGVAGNQGLCLNPDGHESPSAPTFNPGFPSSCPFVTSVGATQINPGAKVTDPESACQQVISSGGGFSNYFSMPRYQEPAVKNYLNKYKPAYPASIWNSTGISRGYPDISANGANYAVAVGGRFYQVYGTSAASPVVGAILTMVNDIRITAGKGPIGFINPAGAFNDITSGSNPGCNTDGFTAVPGWDPVTGLGTPNFPELVSRWLMLP
ncbi:peptidase S8/S53 domain-containing protein [Gymnopilus junonius]|uniref:tripeptidyl-peptidase II n=1 Tax=Gymnopilus junonius TaxID=109634 RepID=A0A9P5NG50_GYMJU|nr:peptidase S8/S53 domain-containing protein [Gymnopilus junonius]